MIDLMTIGGMLGGIGLFMLGMGQMTDGLKLAAGPALGRILAHSTRTRVRGLASGMLVTAMVQSSSAVTVATIGFVNAGLLTLGQSMWVLFGANVGTTMTGWLVALVGLKFKIEALALPLIGIGMALRLTGESSRRGALGLALAGFGVLFLGIDMLKNSFSGLSADFQLPEGDGARDVVIQVLIGILLTVLMQSSSASLTIALTAAQGGLLTAQGAAAVVIGANVGTTVTALLAAIGSTSNSKRTAAAHILFNVLTGVVAFMLLPWLVSAIAKVSDALHLDASPATSLALFHTSFNLLGVVLIWPIADRMTRFLESRFRAADEDEARPRFLDANVAMVPALALDALESEVRRIGGIVQRMLREAVSAADREKLTRDRKIVTRLNQSVSNFIAQISQAGMSQVSARRLPDILRVIRHYEAVADLSMEASAALNEAPHLQAAASWPAFIEQLPVLLSQIALEPPPGDAVAIKAAQQRLEEDYRQVKTELMDAGTSGRLPIVEMDAQLRAASALRRAAKQAVRAVHLLGGKPSAVPDPATPAVPLQ